MKALRVAVTKNTPGKALQSALAGVDVSSEEVSHLLRLAVARGHAGVAAGMLAAGARPGECLGAELLVAALKADAASLVAPLLRALPADADMEGAAASGWTPLFWAAQRGDAAAVEALLAAGAAVGATERSGGTPLMVAVQHGQASAAAALLTANADVEAVDSAGWSAMLWAAQAGDAAMLRLLRGAGASTQSAAGSALMVAVENGRVEAAGELLASATPGDSGGGGGGGDAPAPGLARVEVDARDAQGWTAVAVAAGSGRVKLLRMLLRAGGSPYARTSRTGRTPLMAAAQGGHAAAVQALVEHRVAGAQHAAPPADGEDYDMVDQA